MSDTIKIMSEEDQKLIAQFRELFGQDKNIAEILLELAAARRLPLEFKEAVPKNWSTASHAPYYQEKYARQMQVAVDHLVATKKPVCFYYKDFDCSKATLKIRLNQSFLWLVENGPEEQRVYYFNLKKQMQISMRSAAGPILEYTIDDLVDDELKFGEVPVEADMNKWKDELQDFLDNAAPGSNKKIVGIALSDEEQLEVKTMLQPLEDRIVFVVKKDCIMLGKHPEEGAA